MCKEYDPDLNVQDTFFKRLPPSIQEGILLSFLDLAYDPRPSWTQEPGEAQGGIREFRYDDPARVSPPLVVTYGIDDTNCRLVILGVREGQEAFEDWTEIRFFSRRGEGKIMLEDFFQKVKTTGGSEEVLDVMGRLLRNSNLQYPDSKPLGEGTHELRANKGNNCYRIFYGFCEEGDAHGIVVLLNGFHKTKKEDHEKEKQKAKELLKNVRNDLAGNTMTWQEVKPLLETIFERDIEGP